MFLNVVNSQLIMRIAIATFNQITEDLDRFLMFYFVALASVSRNSSGVGPGDVSGSVSFFISKYSRFLGGVTVADY